MLTRRGARRRPSASVTPGREARSGRGDLGEGLLGCDEDDLRDRCEPELRGVLGLLALGQRPEHHLAQRGGVGRECGLPVVPNMRRRAVATQRPVRSGDCKILSGCSNYPNTCVPDLVVELLQ